MRAFLCADRGGATLEILLWLPILVELVLFTADVSIMYWRHGEMWTVARDTVRQAATGSFTSGGAVVAADVQNYAVSQLTADHNALYYYDGTNDRHGVIITVDSGALSLIGSFANDFGSLAVQFEMVAEN